MNKIGIYSVAFFSLSLQTMLILLIPLYTLSLESTPFLIGVAIGALSFIPMILSIPSGSLIDKIGSKKVISVCSIITMVLLLLYPVVPMIEAIIVFQLVVGQCITMIWIASQAYVTKIVRTSESDGSVKTFSFFASMGTFIGPMATGFFWELSGGWGGFLVIFFWTFCLFVSGLVINQTPTKKVEKKKPIKINNLFGKNFYQKFLMLIGIPAVLMVILGTFLRLTAFSIRGSFYLVYLEEISFSAMSITVLFSSFSLISAISPFFTGLLLKVMEGKYLLYISAMLSILLIIITPLFSDFWVFLLLACFSGFFLGVTLPILLSLLSGSVNPELQGTAIGLRETANRMAAFSVPFVFGLMVEYLGLEVSFFFSGVLLFVLTIIIVPVLFIMDHKYKEKTKLVRAKHN